MEGMAIAKGIYGNQVQGERKGKCPLFHQYAL
jgi:hypothetical protein